ncbi:MAG: hypothetical protein JWR09_5832, partial [Mucilaginibacter sp.]|nr:hypothetical protein [Mucilaginibacter sp.]
MSAAGLFTPRRAASVVLIAGFCVMLAMNAPGQMSYDSVVQLADGRTGFYNSWHPPVMAWLLGLLDFLLPGTLLFLIFQSLLLLASLLTLLWMRPRGWGAVLVALLVVLTPQWLLYQGEIWKDILFADAAIAGFAALALAAQHGRAAWLIASVLLLALAAATRQNGMVLLPVAAGALALIARRGGKSGWVHGAGFLLAGLGLAAAASLTLAGRGDGGDGAQAEIRFGQSYDLAGALARDPGLRLPALAAADPKLDALLRGRGARLYSPLHTDAFAADTRIGDGLVAAPQGAISRAWRELVLDHTLLYLRTRLAAFGAVLRTPDSFVCHFASVGIDGPPALLKSLGLTARIRPQDQALGDYARLFFATPVYAHLAWGILALILLVLLLRRGGAADLAVAALLTGALLFTLSFVIISLACDYRYLVFLDLSAMAAAIYAISVK